MADLVRLCRNAIVGLLTELKSTGTFSRVWTRKPDSISTSCEVSVTVWRLRQRQAGTQTNQESPTFTIVTYVSESSYPEDDEDKLLDAWNDMVAKFIAHVSLDGTCERHTFRWGRMGHARVAGKPCRTMTAYVEPQIVSSQTYS